MKKSVTVLGITYPSISALCQTYGINSDYIYRRMKDNNETIEQVIEHLLDRGFVISGKYYTSIEKACKDQGVSVSRVRRRIKKKGDTVSGAIKYVLEHPQTSFVKWCDDNDRTMLLKEYLYDITNPATDIERLPFASHNRIMWKCSKCGNEWPATLKDRTIGGTNCPQCKLSTHSSKQEQAIYYYIRKYFPETINQYKPKFLEGKEIDVYIPSIGIGIEYDGAQWHKDASRDEKKNRLLSENGITLIRIREFGCPKLKDEQYCVHVQKKTNSIEELKTPLEKVFDIIYLISKVRIKPDIDIDRDYAEILSMLKNSTYEKSLAATGAEFLIEWDWNMNKITPSDISAHSHESCYWICSRCGQRFPKAPHERMVQKQLYCSRCNYEIENKRRAVEDIREGKKKSVADFKELMKEWDPSNQLDPVTTASGSDQEAMWICKTCGYHFLMIIKNRTGPQHQGCPKCGRQSQARIRGIKVRNIDTGEVFESISAASRAYSRSKFATTNVIRNCCIGKAETAYGYRWEYYKTENL